MTDQHDARDAAAKKLAECMDYPWEHMPAKGREAMRQHAQAVIDAYVATQPTKPEQQAGGVPAGFDRARASGFLSDVITAAGLLEHGRQCKALATSIASEAFALNTMLAAAPSQSAVQPLSEAQRKPLTDKQIEKLRDDTFSINNPFCPVDSKSMRKAVRAAERAHGIVTEEPGNG